MPGSSATLTGTDKMANLCKDCAFFDFKVSAEKSWGVCWSERQNEAVRVFYMPANFVWELGGRIAEQIIADVKDFASVRFCESEFGCIYWEPKT